MDENHGCGLRFTRFIFISENESENKSCFKMFGCEEGDWGEKKSSIWGIQCGEFKWREIFKLFVFIHFCSIIRHRVNKIDVFFTLEEKTNRKELII